MVRIDCEDEGRRSRKLSVISDGDFLFNQNSNPNYFTIDTVNYNQLIQNHSRCLE